MDEREERDIGVTCASITDSQNDISVNLIPWHLGALFDFLRTWKLPPFIFYFSECHFAGTHTYNVYYSIMNTKVYQSLLIIEVHY